MLSTFFSTAGKMLVESQLVGQVVEYTSAKEMAWLRESSTMEPE